MRALLQRLPFALAITLALALKLVLLFVLYKAFFAAPQVKKMRMPTARVEQHLLDAPAAATASAGPAKPAAASAPAVTATLPPSPPRLQP